MKSVYRITVTRKISKLVGGMWVEIISQVKPNPKAIADAFNQKYELSMPSGSIASYALDIQKMG